MNNKTKIIIAVVLFSLAAVVVAYQFGLFGDASEPKPAGEIKKSMETTAPAVLDGGSSKPAG